MGTSAAVRRPVVLDARPDRPVDPVGPVDGGQEPGAGQVGDRLGRRQHGRRVS